MKSESNLGLVLLVFNAIPAAEDPLDPTSPKGLRRMSAELEEALIEHWDDMVVHDTTIPLLLVSFPGFGQVVSTSLSAPIAQKYPSGLLHHIEIPQVDMTDVSQLEQLLSLVTVREKIVEWLDTHTFKLVMVKPFSNYGAVMERRILEHFANEQPPTGKGSSSTSDLRPVAIEAIPFDGKDGPILGLYKSGNESRPALMPSTSWQAQKYRPQAGDHRATGTFYFNLPMTSYCLQDSHQDGLTDLDQWSTGPLLRVSESDWRGQPAIFEDALSDLARLLRIRPVMCDRERGERGYRSSLFSGGVQ